MYKIQTNKIDGKIHYKIILEYTQGVILEDVVLPTAYVSKSNAEYVAKELLKLPDIQSRIACLATGYQSLKLATKY